MASEHRPGIRQEPSGTMAQVVARAWSDADFKRRLLDQPAQVLRECGFAPPPGMEIRVVEPPDNVFYFVLPPKPRDVTELTAAQLDGVAGGIIAVLIGLDSSSGSTGSSSCVACMMF